jgi:hypothetical protein
MNATGLAVTADMFCEELWADGGVDLNGASIGGQLTLSGAHLDGSNGPALTAQNLTVAADMFCDARASWP